MELLQKMFIFYEFRSISNLDNSFLKSIPDLASMIFKPNPSAGLKSSIKSSK